MNDSYKLPQSSVTTTPSPTDIFNLRKREIFMELCSHHIGTIQAFNPANQTTSVSINYKRTVKRLNPKTKVYEQVLVDYPVLQDCPTVFLGGGSSSLTFPIEKGDECIVLFNDRDIDNWFAGSAPGQTASLRLHSFSDAMVIVGIRSLSKLLDSIDPLGPVLRNGKTFMRIGTELIKLANSRYTLNELMQELVTDIKSLVSATASITVSGVTTGPGVSGPPLNVAAINAAGTQLTTTANKIAGLLE